MNKPIISDNFTVDDIHKIREYHYETTKNMSSEDRDKYYEDKASIFRSKLKKKADKVTA